ncbi:MAG TPA: acyl-CoA dehydrogenase family protein [Gemmatimonadales bacterium]|nr:acyl-CoA dehydrogenase family protein [Gemmatimonadales bacterium]
MTTLDMSPQMEQQRREIVALAREFAARELAPHAAEWDKAGRYPPKVLKHMGELGFLGLLVPEAHDGLGLDALTYVMVLEEIAAADASASIVLGVHNSLGCTLLMDHGTEAQKERWLRPMARGEILAAFALSEAESGSDASALRTHARREGDCWVLNGVKGWVTSGDVADLVFVMARTDSPETRSGSRGISTFIVPTSTAGVSPGKAEDKMGLRASRTTGLVLQDVRLPADHLLGESGAGLRYALGALNSGRLGVGAQAVGIARAALDASVRYAGERRQFDRPIREFQAIQFKLADMATRVAAARALVHEGARARARGEGFATWASMAKLFASETAMWVTMQAVQVFGGYGYMRDYPVERLFRDAKVTEIYEGTSEVQRILIARSLQA